MTPTISPAPSRGSGRYKSPDAQASRDIRPRIEEPVEVTEALRPLVNLLLPNYDISDGHIRKRTRDHWSTREELAAIKSLCRIRGYRYSYYVKSQIPLKGNRPCPEMLKHRDRICRSMRAKRLAESQRHSARVLAELPPINRPMAEPPCLEIADGYVEPRREPKYLP